MKSVGNFLVTGTLKPDDQHGAFVRCSTCSFVSNADTISDSNVLLLISSTYTYKPVPFVKRVGR